MVFFFFSGDLSINFSLKCYPLKTLPGASDLYDLKKPLKTGYYEPSLFWYYSLHLKAGS